MRSFTLSIFATLAFVVFSFAAPMLAGPSVNAIAARTDEHTTDNCLQVVLETCITVITPITEKLGCLTADEISVELVASITADLKVALNLVIAQITALKGVSLEKVLCSTAGGVLGAADIAALLVSVLTLVLNACASVVAVVAVSLKVDVCALLAEIGCLVGSLLCAVLGLVGSLSTEIIACIVPQISACIAIIVTLKLDILVKALCLTISL